MESDCVCDMQNLESMPGAQIQARYLPKTIITFPDMEPPHTLCIWLCEANDKEPLDRITRNMLTLHTVPSWSSKPFMMGSPWLFLAGFKKGKPRPIKRQDLKD